MPAPKTPTNNSTSPSLSTISDVIKGASNLSAIPLWTEMAKHNPPSPNPRCTPSLWRYSDLHPYLLRAGELVQEKDAERRVLMLVNPSLQGPYTTDTLYAGLQLVMPNETAPAHRHTAFAMRFVIEGDGGFTAVHGKRIRMQKHDVILTPSWNWHDHGNDGTAPVIWLDALDLPSFRHFPVHFVEHYDKPRYPAEDVESSQSAIVFRWSDMKAELDNIPGAWATKEYRNADGSYVSKTLSASAERINKSMGSSPRRETASSVYHVVAGSGYSNINGERFEWDQGDTFCIPSWYKYEHFAGPDETVYLYRFDDKPMLEALGFYRWEGMDTETLAV